jgi:hypothetical protein
MPPASGDLITVRIVGTLSGQPIINNLSFSIINPAATWGDQVTQAATDLNGVLGVLGGGSWYEARAAEYLVQEVQVVDVAPGTSPMGSVAAGAGGALGTDQSMPPNDALAITFRSDFKGPSGRGRIYLSGYPEAYAVGGYWTTEAQDNASGIASTLLENFGELAAAANMRWVILHRSSNGGVPGGPQVPVVPPEVKPVMSFTVHNEVRSLGRRAMGRRIRRVRAGA